MLHLLLGSGTKAGTEEFHEGTSITFWPISLHHDVFFILAKLLAIAKHIHILQDTLHLYTFFA